MVVPLKSHVSGTGWGHGSGEALEATACASQGWVPRLSGRRAAGGRWGGAWMKLPWAWLLSRWARPEDTGCGGAEPWTPAQDQGLDGGGEGVHRGDPGAAAALRQGHPTLWPSPTWLSCCLSPLPSHQRAIPGAHPHQPHRGNGARGDAQLSQGHGHVTPTNPWTPCVPSGAHPSWLDAQAKAPRAQ